MGKLQRHLINEAKASNQDVANAISSDGLGYAIQFGISAREIKDPKLAKMWKQASKLMNDIENYLGELIEEM